MTALERLNSIASTLDESAIDILISVAQLMPPEKPLSYEEFLGRMAATPAEEIDAETAAMLRETHAEKGENIPFEEVKRRYGLR